MLYVFILGLFPAFHLKDPSQEEMYQMRYGKMRRQRHQHLRMNLLQHRISTPKRFQKQSPRRSPRQATLKKLDHFPARVKSAKIDPVDEQLLNYLNSKSNKSTVEQCADQQFLNSLLPELKGLAEPTKMQTKIKIMELLLDAKHRTPSSFPQQLSS